MKQCYKPKTFKEDTLKLIAMISVIVEDYQRQNFRLTVRQLYYQLVSKDLIKNTLQEYKRIASIINDAKLAGLLDWEAIEDRTREFVRKTRWQSGAHIMRAAVSSFHKDMWVGQSHRVFVIIEKEALVGVLEPTCNELDIPLLAARGYPSGTVLREFVLSDIRPCLREGKQPIILHLGDHDPSGIDMTRDLQDRINLFANDYIDIRRIALTMDQIEEQQPPENPAKTTDSRFEKYMEEFGESSWELDALSPAYLADLVRSHVEEVVDQNAWETVEQEVEDTKQRIIQLTRDFK